MSGSGKLERGYLHLYAGRGKGASAAALGIAFRAVGHNLKVQAILFLKGNLEYGEQETARRLAPFVDIRPMGRDVRIDPAHVEQIDIKWAQEGWQLACAAMEQGRVDVLILDEITTAIELGLLELDGVLDRLRTRPQDMEIVLTGAHAPEPLVQLCDVVTILQRKKHYLDRGIAPRPGIDT